MNDGDFPTLTQTHSYKCIPLDWDGDGDCPGRCNNDHVAWVDPDDARITRDTGVSWIQLNGDNRSHKVDRIYDGQDSTILLGENLNAGVMGTWSDPGVQNCGFVYPVDPIAAGPENFNAPPSPPRVNPLPNAMRTGPEGTPFLSSNHPGIVNVAMVSGRVMSLSDDIDATVYTRLMTPAGARVRAIPGFAADSPLSDNDF